MGQVIDLVDGTVRVSTAVSQPLVQSVEVAGFASLELLLGVQAIEGVTQEVTVEVLTGVSLESEDGWRVAATFGSITASDTWRKRTLTGLLRYVRYRVASVTGIATISLRGVGRRWRKRGFVPTDIPGCAAWYRADLGVTLNGSNVSAWADQSEHARDLLQTTGASQPLLVENAVNAQPALRFDGSDDFMKVPFTLNVPLQHFLVYKMVTVGAPLTNDCILDGYGTATCVIAADTTPRTVIFDVSAIVTTHVIANGVYALLTTAFDTTASLMRENGVQTASGTLSTNPAAGLTVGGIGGGGASRCTNIEVAELIVYSEVLTASDRDRVEEYFINRYGLL